MASSRARLPASDEPDEIRQPDWPRRLTAATVFGTFALVFVAAGADVMARISGDEVGAAARAVAPALMVAR